MCSLRSRLSLVLGLLVGVGLLIVCLRLACILGPKGSAGSPPCCAPWPLMKSRGSAVYLGGAAIHPSNAAIPLGGVARAGPHREQFEYV